MKTRILYTKFWQDHYVCSLNIKEKLVFLYLLTNEKVNLCGIYELSDKVVKMDLEITQSELDKIKQKFINDKRFIFYNGWVKIINGNKYNNFSGEKNEIAKQKELNFIPLELLNDTLSIPYRYPSDSLNNHNHNQKSIINNPLINNKKSERSPSEIMKDFILIVQAQDMEFDSLAKEIATRFNTDENFVKKEILKFIDYWTELNRSGTKQRWELEKTFEVQKRLSAWFNNINKFNKIEKKKGFKNYDI